nr:DUF4139 domain-containing protein [Armatimonadota bacterium]
DHDWDNIQLTLVSGRPISFIQDLYTPLYVPRPIVPPDVQANPYPQLAEDNLMENAKTALNQSMDERRRLGGQNQLRNGINNSFSRSAGGAGGFGGGQNGQQIQQEVNAPAAMAADAAPAPGTPPMDLQGSGVASQATGEKAGELYQYRIGTPITIPRQQSAMIPIVTGAITAEKLDLFNADVNPRYPQNAVHLTNSTGLHLKAGPVTVLDGSTYAGDARMPELEPGEKQLITYAVDLGIASLREQPVSETRLTAISIKHGVLNLSSRSQLTTKYTFKSKLDRDRVVMVEQPIREGWDLKEPAKPDEKTHSFYRFLVPVAAGKSVNTQVVEVRPEMSALGLVDIDMNILLQYRTDAAASAQVKAALADIADRRAKIAQLQNELDGQKARITTITEEQNRIRQNMGQLDQTSALYKRYVGELDTQETLLTTLRGDIDRLTTEITAARAAMIAAVDGLTVE